MGTEIRSRVLRNLTSAAGCGHVRTSRAPREGHPVSPRSNDASRYPADSLDAMKRFVRDQRWPIRYLHDESQEVAPALGAQVTPHVFVLDADHVLRYRGAPDADHQDPRAGRYLREALNAVLSGSRQRMLKRARVVARRSEA